MANRDRDRRRDERVIPEGMGGAGGGDLDDMGDVGYPERAADAVPSEGIARNGDRNAMGNTGFPDNQAGDDISGTPAVQDTEEREFRQAQAVTGARAKDIEIARQMGGGDTGTAPGIPQGDLSREEVANARDTARGLSTPGTDVAGSMLGGGDEDVGAPWDDLPEGARMRTPQNADLESGGKDNSGT